MYNAGTRARRDATEAQIDRYIAVVWVVAPEHCV